jgi:WhiB family redox-sensing transcriptional regulator
MSGIRAEQTGWRDQALCAQGIYPPDLWFQTNADAKRKAKQICLACPVRADCLADALASPTCRGVVAARTPSQVTKLKRRAA